MVAFLRRSPAASPARTPPTASAARAAEEAAAGLDDFVAPTAAGMVDFVGPTPAETLPAALAPGPAGNPVLGAVAATSSGAAHGSNSAAGSSGAGAAPAAGPEPECGPGAGAGAADGGGERAPKRRRVPLVGLQARCPSTTERSASARGLCGRRALIARVDADCTLLEAPLPSMSIRRMASASRMPRLAVRCLRQARAADGSPGSDRPRRLG